MIRRFALVASALSGLPLLAAWIIAQRVLHPTARVEDHTPEDFSLPTEAISFPSRDGTRLSAWFIPAARATAGPGIVLSHGWARSRAELLPHADLLHRAGFSVLAFDYRHRGESGGTEVTMGLRERDDLLGALDELSARPEVDATRVGLLGMSMGAVVALLVTAADERVGALVAECPYAAAETIMTRGLRHYYRLPSFPIGSLAKWIIERRIGEPLEVADALQVIDSISPRPLLLIADEADAVIGPDETERLFRAAGEPKELWLIPDADHARGWQAAPQEYERRVAAFFQDALGEPPVPAQYAKTKPGEGA